MSNKIKVWITKHDLNEEIIETEAEICEHLEGMIETEDFGFLYEEGKEWHRTKEEAIKRVEEIKRLRINAKKRLEQLKDFKFK